MKIEVFYIRDCPNYRPSVNRLKAVLQREGLRADISEIEVEDDAAAAALQFPGSPTIRINGLDIELDSRTVAATGLACRRYLDGLPSEEMIRAALRRAQEESACNNQR
ncbi:MAG TPA: hypothetical protein VEV17_22365 [Bryobacteraceae bacterium]|nr:hypothetical protein [Bryobacteraceae bacterium]